MGKIILVTGGARSGKSTYAEQCVTELGGKIGYIATAKVTDEDMAKRIEHHRSQRPAEWPTFELYKDFQTLLSKDDFMTCDALILDCITILVTNNMFDHDVDYDTVTMDQVAAIESLIADEIMSLLEIVRDMDMNLVLVSNEVGLGLVPPYRLGNLFRDIAGRMNQMIAAEADQAYFIVSGLPLTLKG